ncbi:unnamed protein product, partial [Echinostoma caproni]|uniref:INT8 protein n=1 Tax=Echinostoma caproni TaxID=27848 RepID=A0A183B3I9_9TREM
RIPTTEFVQKFNAQFDEQFVDSHVLHDQTFFTEQESNKPEADTECNEATKIVRTPEDDLEQLHRLPKEFSKTFVVLYKSLIGLNIPESRLAKAMERLSHLLEECVREQFHTGVVLRCLSHALRLQQQEPFTSFAVKPKRLFKLLFSHPQFTAVLHPDYLIPSAKSANPVESATTDSFSVESPVSCQFLRDCLMELLVTLVRQSPKSGLKYLQPLWLLGAYSATLSPSGK